MPSKPGRKWGHLRGDYAEVCSLADVLRDIADSHGLTLRDLETRMPYRHTVISENLNGAKRPAWKFVAAFLDACAGRDQHARAVLQSRVRPLWEAASPGQATLIHATEAPADPLIPAEVQAWVTSLRETALAQQRVASLQASVSRHIGLVNGLMEMLARLGAAADALARERDALRRELKAHAGVAEELIRMRALTEETQHRLEVAEALQAETSRRLDDALRQRQEAERLKAEALAQAEAARRRLTGLEQRAVAFMEYLRHEPGSEDLGTSDSSLMGTADQVVAAEIFRRVDSALDDEAANLARLHDEVTAVKPDTPQLSAVQPGNDNREKETGAPWYLNLPGQADGSGWWHHFSDVMPEWFQPYVVLEERAASLRVYEW